MKRKKRKNYTKSFKEEAVKLIINDGKLIDNI
jgi:transposase-like protein